MKILHGPVNVGNQPWVLSNRERDFGHESRLVVNYNTWLDYPVDKCLSQLGKKSISAIAKRMWFALSSPFKFDIFHYYFGRSFMCWDDWGSRNPLWYSDMKLAKALGKKVFLTFQGCDARLGGRSNQRNRVTPCRERHCKAYPVCSSGYDTVKLSAIQTIASYADKIFVLNPELAHYVPQSTFLPYTSIKMTGQTFTPPRTEGPLRFLHAPSSPDVKGTEFVIEAVERIRKTHEVEFVLVQGLPHAEAIKLYSSADLVIDQLLCGWYGGFAVEVMAMGKPVIAYMRDEDFDVLPRAMREEIPVISATPDTIYQTLVEAIANRRYWPEWGKKSYDFVHRWHNPSFIAKAMVFAYTDEHSCFDLESVIKGF